MAGGEHVRLGRAVDRQRDEVVDVLGLAVALAYADQPVAVRRDAQVGVADPNGTAGSGVIGSGSPPGVEPVDALVGVVAEVDRVVVRR